jgi:L-alanine-DL-glutamate epimerase-like enolase superfamily enzyme
VRDGGLPIATGENLHTPYEFKQMTASGAVTFPEADVTNCGGVTAFIKISHRAEAFNLPITSHGAHDITIQLPAAVPNRSYLEVYGFGLERFLTHSLEVQDGFATAPERPGHGVEFDRQALDAARTS